MSDERATRRSRRRRGWIIGVVAVFGVIAAAVASLVYGGLKARAEIEAASSSVNAVRSEVLSGDTEKAFVNVAAAQDQTQRARDLTHGPVWSVAGAIPWVGHTPGLISTATDAANEITRAALPGLVESSSALSAAAVASGGDLRIDVKALAQAAGPIGRANEVLQQQKNRLADVPTSGVPTRLTGPFDDLQTTISDVASLTSGLSDIASVAPSMLGATATKRYLLAVQQPAEARGTGGLLGAYAVLEVTDGRVSVARTGPRSDLDPSNQSAPRVDLGADYAQLWGEDPGWWVNGNVSPNFPYAAQIWSDLGRRAGLGRIDGVIATDPIALAALMKVTGPVTANGRSITADELVPLVTKGVYAQIPNDDNQRDVYLQGIAAAVLGSVLSGKGDTGQWLDALGAMAQQRRVLLWSADQTAQSVIADSPAGGSVPDGGAQAKSSPYAFVVVNNTGGTKLDSYLKRTVEYRGGACEADSRVTTLTITLTNDAPTGLPPYVVTRSDRGGRNGTTVIANGDNRLLVSSYLSAGAGVLTATLDGQRLAVTAGSERGHPVIAFPLESARGSTHVVVLTLREPRTDAPARLDVQPLVLDQKSVVDVAPC